MGIDSIRKMDYWTFAAVSSRGLELSNSPLLCQPESAKTTAGAEVALTCLHSKIVTSFTGLLHSFQFGVVGEKSGSSLTRKPHPETAEAA
jgi:hypothetical protein